MLRQEEEEQVFNAVSHPMRRVLLEALRDEERSVVELAAPFDVSRPAISQHLRILKEAGLVTERRVGRLNLYALNPEPLQRIDEWVSFFRVFWPERLDRLGKFLDSTAKRHV